MVAVVLLWDRCSLLFSCVIPCLMNEACWLVSDRFINTSSGRNGRLVNDLRNGLQTSHMTYIWIKFWIPTFLTSVLIAVEWWTSRPGRITPGKNRWFRWMGGYEWKFCILSVFCVKTQGTLISNSIEERSIFFCAWVNCTVAYM